MTDFDPAQHRMCDPSYFEDLEVGQTFYINSRTQTDALFSAFQLASGTTTRSTTTSNTASGTGIAACWRTGCRSWRRRQRVQASSRM